MGFNDMSLIEQKKVAKAKYQNTKNQFLYCEKCPVQDYCRRQTPATCPLVKLVEEF